jgi:hypothetical protein
MRSPLHQSIVPSRPVYEMGMGIANAEPTENSLFLKRNCLLATGAFYLVPQVVQLESGGSPATAVCSPNFSGSSRP